MNDARSNAVSMAALSLCMAVTACGGGGGSKASQVAAKVNKGEISVHQINSVLARYQGLPPEGVGQAKSQILEKLIDQELLVQKALEAKVDRDPQVMQAIEAARRQMLAQAYVERTVAQVPKPSAQEIRAFYAEHPQLFQERRIYRLQEFAVSADDEQAQKLRGEVARGRSINEITAWLRAQGIKFRSNAAVKPAEQLPLEALPQFAAAKDGQIFVFPASNGSTSVVQVMDSQLMPMTEQDATPYIEQYLLNQLRSKFAEKEVKDLRVAAKVEYVGEFAGRSAAAVAPAAVSGPAGVVPADRGDFVGRGLSGMK